MAALFNPDIFSQGVPLFSGVAVSVEAGIRAVATECFRTSLPAIDSVLQFGGNEINSNNFRLYTERGEFLLKRLPGAIDTSLLERQLLLSEWLRGERSIALPKVFSADNARSLTTCNGSHWCLFEFVPGNFFQGVHSELATTALQIGRMQRALAELPAGLLPASKWAYNTDADAQVFAAAAQSRSQWSELFGEPTSDYLAAHWDHIERAVREQAQNIERMQAGVIGACHCDLHPHNILVADGALTAFIDFESFVAMPVDASLGFAAFKLIRQHATATGIADGSDGRLAAATRAFIGGVEEGMDSPGIDIDALRFMATAEVLRRLIVVLRLNLQQRNTAWNHVLPMHVAGLHEIDRIFA